MIFGVNEPAGEIDRRKIRIGLLIVSAVFVAALVVAVVIDDAAGRAFMIAIVVIAFVRAALLARSLKKERG